MKNIILIILVILSFDAFSQSEKEFFICDKDLNAIPYVSVYIQDTNYGTYSNINGLCNFKIKNNKDTIIINCIGYKSLKVQFANIEDTLILEQSDIRLNKIIIKEEYEYKYIGFDKRKTSRAGHTYGLIGHIQGLVIKNIEFAKIEEISLNIFASNDSSCTKFLLHINEIDTTTNLPTKSLLSEQLFFDDSKKGWSTINIDSLNIYIEGEIFIGVETVPNFDLISDDIYDVRDQLNSRYSTSVYPKNNDIIYIVGKRGIGISVYENNIYNIYPMIRAKIKY